jgi:hypothetical protein
MKTIEMYLLAAEYSIKVSFLTNRKAMKTANTNRYLTQNSPSLITMATRFLHTIITIISKNRARKLSEMR